MRTFHVCVQYQETLDGATLLAYAGALVARLGTGKLLLYAAPPPVLLPDASEPAGQTDRERIIAAAARATGLAADKIDLRSMDQRGIGYTSLPEGALAVWSGSPRVCSNVSVLNPFNETAIARGQSEGPLLIPFGNKLAGTWVASYGIELARQMRLSVLFYHTTWVEKEEPSEDPQSHMCAGAKSVLQALTELANSAGVDSEAVVETAEDVAQGIVRCAIRKRTAIATDGAAKTAGACMIVMACSQAGGAGSYVHQVMGLQPPFLWLETTGRRLCHEKKNSGTSQSLLGDDFRRLHCLCRWLAKVGIGTTIASPMITGDGWHNLADLFQSAAIVWAMAIANRPKSELYHYGRKNIEFLASLFIGMGLIFLSLKFAGQSIAGILSNLPEIEASVRSYVPLPEIEPVRMNDQTFPWAVAVIVISIVLSNISSRLQIGVGKRSGHPIMVAGGEETRSDARIECVTLAAILMEHYWSLAWLEYPFALVVSILIALTGGKLFLAAYRVILHRSIGIEHERVIVEEIMSTPGLLGIKQVKTFQVGHRAVINLTLVTMRDTRVNDVMREGIEPAIKDYVLKQEEFRECEIHIEFQPPEAKWHRVALAVKDDGQTMLIADTFAEASHLIVCTVESLSVNGVTNSRIIRHECEPVSSGASDLLREKRVEKLYVFKPQLEPLDLLEGVTAIEQATCHALCIWDLSADDFCDRQTPQSRATILLTS